MGVEQRPKEPFSKTRRIVLRLGLIAGAIAGGIAGVSCGQEEKGETPPPVQTQEATITPSWQQTQESTPTLEPTQTPTSEPNLKPEELAYLHNHQIVIVKYTNENSNSSGLDSSWLGELWLMNADNTEGKVLLTGANHISAPTWAPDGEIIAILYSEEDEDLEDFVPAKTSLILLDSSGKVLEKIERPGNVHDWDDDFSWAPDGKSIIYSFYLDGIYEFNLQTRETQAIINTTDRTFDHCPVWSPDKSKLAFVHHEFGEKFYVSLIEFDPNKVPYKGEDRNNNIFNPEIQILVSGESNYDEDLRLQWTPDGQKLVFSTDYDDGIIYVADVVNNSVSEIKLKDLGLHFPSFNPLISYRELSPDGKEIAITSGDSLYLINIDGTNLRKLAKVNKVDLSGVSPPSWSTDGRYLSFMSSQDLRGSEDIYVVSRDGEVVYKFPSIAQSFQISDYSNLDWKPTTNP